ncbi:hypothetical protein LN042_22980 [Kitasatospora sp. RB6PN24]|uniref:hypothetical protein n=1 Tax=Kitasatospora humi TaxID=2893891 RepID=UPI001E5A2C8F|nr:hypothetical protein [Kitasatospora humi]MCC9309900.1 hypothetical protein [Kitasatospora humi]
MDLENLMEQAAQWLVKADHHYEHTAALNAAPQTAARAATEMELAKYAHERYRHYADAAKRAKSTSHPADAVERPESRARGVRALQPPAISR